MQLVIFLIVLVLFIADKVYGNPVVWGQFSPIHLYPWVVSLQIDGYHNCGGSIISSTTILTAAHCAKHPPESYVVRAGSARTDSGGTWHKVVRIKRHEDFNKEPRSILDAVTDVALMEVSPPIELGRYGALIQLPRKGYVVPVGTNVTVMGWGSRSYGGEVTDELISANLRIVDSAECARAYGDYTGTQMKSGHEICASKLGSGPCHGDSGGPLVTKEDVQVGIVSRSRGCGDDRYPGTYEDVGYHRDWIDKNLKNWESVRPKTKEQNITSG